MAGRGGVAAGTELNTGGEPRASVAAVAAGWRLSLAWRFSRARVQVVDSAVAALCIAGVRERVGLEGVPYGAEDDDMNVFDEVVGGRAAVASNVRQFTILSRLDKRPEFGVTEPVDSFRVDHGAVGEDLPQHAELAAIIRPAQGHAGQERVGGGDRTADARPRTETGLAILCRLKDPGWTALPTRSVRRPGRGRVRHAGRRTAGRRERASVTDVAEG